MKSVLRVLMLLSVGLAIVTGLVLILPTTFPGLTDLPRLYQQLESSRQEGEELDAEAKESLDRCLRRHAVTRDLLEGRLTLAEALAIFRTLNDEEPRVAVAARRLFPADSTDDTVLRHLLWYAAGDAPEVCPERSREVLDRLNEEVRSL